MWRRRFSVAALFLVAPTWLLAMPEEHERWNVFRCGYLVVYSAVPERETEKVAAQVVRFRNEVFHPSRPISAPAPAETTRVFIFDEDEDLQAYERHGYAAWYQQGTGVNYLLLRQERWEDSLPLALSMESMMVLSRAYSRVPPWVERGLAKFYATYRPKGDKARIGRATDYTLEVLRERSLLPWERLLEIGSHSPEIHDPNVLTVFDAQAWLLVQYLIAELGGGESAMAAYLNLLEAGAEPGPAFERAFGVSTAEIPARLDQHVEKSSYKAFEFERPDAPEPEVAGPERVAYPVLLEELGEMTVSLNSGADRELEMFRRTQAAEHFQAALAADADLACAYRGLGLASLLAGDADGAKENLRRAAELDPAEPRTHLLLAKALWSRYARRKIRFQVRSHRPTPDDIVELRGHLEVCLAASPELLEAQVLLGTTYLQDPQGPGPGILVLDRVLQTYPGRADVRQTLIFLYLRLGDVDSAFATAVAGRRDDDSFARNLELVVDGALFHAGREVADDPARAQKIVDTLLRYFARDALLDRQARDLARVEGQIAQRGG